MDEFEIGEIAEALKISEGVWKGCEIVSALYTYCGELGHDIMVKGEICQNMASKNGEYFGGLQNLRKKKPPQQLGRWERIERKTGWNPNKVTAIIQRQA